jgi:hypothetical protein
MASEREISRIARQREAEKLVLDLRKHWLGQLLNWPLKDGPLADRLTKGEIAALKKAANQGKRFHGSAKKH